MIFSSIPDLNTEAYCSPSDFLIGSINSSALSELICLPCAQISFQEEDAEPGTNFKGGLELLPTLIAEDGTKPF